MSNLAYLKYLPSSQDYGLSSALGPVHTQLSPLLPGRNRCRLFFFFFFNFLKSFQCFLTKNLYTILDSYFILSLLFPIPSYYYFFLFQTGAIHMSDKLELKFLWLLKRHLEVNPLVCTFPAGELVV